MKVQYQHKVPQRDLDHEVKPTRSLSGDAICEECGRRIIKVRPDDGPETLKALFRF